MNLGQLPGGHGGRTFREAALFHPGWGQNPGAGGGTIKIWRPEYNDNVVQYDGKGRFRVQAPGLYQIAWQITIVGGDLVPTITVTLNEGVQAATGALNVYSFTPKDTIDFTLAAGTAGSELNGNAHKSFFYIARIG